MASGDEAAAKSVDYSESKLTPINAPSWLMDWVHFKKKISSDCPMIFQTSKAFYQTCMLICRKSL